MARVAYNMAAMEKRWQPGDVILNEAYTGAKPRLILVFPAIVVADTDSYLALYHPLGHTFANSDLIWPGGSRHLTPIQERARLFLEWECKDFREVSSRRHVLYLEPHGSMHAVWLFWDEEWNVINWYVNLQAPYVRSDTGIQVTDYYLDLQVNPDLSWGWKDREEFEAMCDAGAFSREEAQAIWAEGEMMAGRIEARGWPFNESWPVWRPDPSWPLPRIHDYWTPPSGHYV